MNQCGGEMPSLLSKKQADSNVNVDFVLLLYRRMREGYTVNVSKSYFNLYVCKKVCFCRKLIYLMVYWK